MGLLFGMAYHGRVAMMKEASYKTSDLVQQVINDKRWYEGDEPASGSGTAPEDGVR